MRKLLITYSLLLFCVLAYAQYPTVATGLPYECSFEEGDTTLSAWTLNYGTPTNTDKWMYGTAVHSEGKRSMYISSDGISPVYGKNPNVSVAILRYKFPAATSIQKYDVSFDWKGVGDSTLSKMHVLFCKESELTATGGTNLANILNSPQARLSNQALQACQNLGESGEKFVCGSETWQNVSFGVSVSGNNSKNTFVFVFIWANGNTKDSLHISSIAVDNFQINSNSIAKPENVNAYPQCEDSTLLVKWESTAGEFDIEYRATGAASWSKASGLVDGAPDFSREGTTASECSYVLKRILEGTYDIRIRAISRDGNVMLRTSFVYLTQVLVYCPDNHCINYIAIDDSTRVICTTGMHEKHTGQTPYDVIGVMDYGPDSENSRHTVHKDPNELDPRADSLLHTVPPGALASVRLGNWNASGKAQSITYKFTVDTTTQGILILKYAVVLDNSGHARDEEPYFRLEILDENDQLIDHLCGQTDFAYSDAVAAQDLESWHLTTYHGEQLAWKDWTTVGLDLMKHHGENLKVRITTADCGQTVHYGYGYFTLDCANAHIETNNCGNDASITCYAPEGFAYAWYNENGDTISHNRELQVDASRQTYTCRVSFIEEPSCGFEISTLSAPRFPVPEYTYEPIRTDCLSKLKFTNTSHVMNKFEGYENHTTEPCTDWYWRFTQLSNGNFTETSATHPIYVCPIEGDSIEVTYTCYIGAEKACDSTRVDTIVVPSILSDTTKFSYTTCPENAIKFDDKWFNEDTVYVAKYPNAAGCDSVSILYLKVHPKAQDIYRHDSICSDQAVVINGVKYNQPLDNYLIMLRTVNDCDSAIYLTLTVNDRLRSDMDSLHYACSDAPYLAIPLKIQAGQFDSLVIKFNTPELRDTVIYDTFVDEVYIPFAPDILPGHYTATLDYYQYCCGTHTMTTAVDVRYRSSIVEQKWNDVLTLLSPKYNGGFEFTAYQWYKNDQPLPGETHSYLYQPLDMDAFYYVELTRADGVTITTCPMQPELHEDQTKFPTIVSAGKRVPMYMAHPTTVWYYTMSGQLYTTFGMPQGYTDLITPAQQGVYIVKSVNSEGETQAQTMIVE